MWTSKKPKHNYTLALRSQTAFFWVKKHWFYYVFAQQKWKTIGFIERVAERHWKTIGFTVKRAPDHRKTNPGQPGHGSGVWRSPTRQDKLWGTLTDKLFREWNLANQYLQNKINPMSRIRKTILQQAVSIYRLRLPIPNLRIRIQVEHSVQVPNFRSNIQEISNQMPTERKNSHRNICDLYVFLYLYSLNPVHVVV